MHDAKSSRLLEEYQKLLKLERRSKFIKVEPLDVQPGYPPEKYLITYTCRGIARIRQDGEPVTSELHQVEMYLIDFPVREPILRWVTDIWHPNIEHDGPRKVCTDNAKSWFPTKSLDSLVFVMGEMVQYKRYHAEWKPPYPVDKEAASWVLDYAEPNKIVGKDKPFDDRQLLRRMPFAPEKMRKPERLFSSTKDSGGRPKVIFGEMKPKNSKVIFGKPSSDK
jgi:ubiquitin-protein ligase